MELLIVVFILGVLSILAFPNIYGLLGTYRLDAAAKEMTADLRWAEQTALVRAAPVKVCFAGATENGYVIEIAEDLGLETMKEVSLPPGIEIKTVTFPDQVLNYSALGRPAESGYIELINKQGKSLHIEVLTSGRIKLTSTRP